jgi:iron complex outermembrane receptor protein
MRVMHESRRGISAEFTTREAPRAASRGRSGEPFEEQRAAQGLPHGARASLLRRRAFPPIVIACLAHACVATSARAADGSDTNLPVVVVTATRNARPAFDVPAAIDAVALDPAGASTPGINPSEYLGSVPGLIARDRQNYAQDEQLSIRGFGARSSFGVRGVRLYVDGIPATMPDGQGQVANLNLASADRIEVLRGPFSALYGNASGGVVQIFTADGTDPASLRAALDGGSYGTYRLDANARGAGERYDYNVDVSQFYTDNYRAHGRAQRENGNAKFDWRSGEGGKLTLVVNTVALPNADDALGLTRAQFEADPRAPQPVAVQFDTRKSVHQQEAGAIYEHDLGAGQDVRVLAYYGLRDVQQFQAIPLATQARPTSPGGVVDLDGNFGGTDARWTSHASLAGRPFELTAGVDYDRQDQHRRGFNNYIGAQLGVAGALRRDEQDDVYNFDQYAQARWDFAERWSLSGGLRHSAVHFTSVDHYVNATSPDDSGAADYAATTPVLGVLFRATSNWNLYASAGNAFETPTFNELGYRPDGSAGINFGLVPARSRNEELGSKWRFGRGSEFDVALFDATTRHELAVDNSTGGRTTYQNIDRARRRGVEARLLAPIAEHWRFEAAYTYLEANFLSSFLTCPAASTCTTPNTRVPAGARIPGVPRTNAYAALRFGAAVGWNASIEASAASATPVNDLDTQFAPGYAIVNLSTGYVFDLAGAHVAPYLRLNNVFDRSYSGSVIVNESNGRYFEPAPRRNVFGGLRIDWKS